MQLQKVEKMSVKSDRIEAFYEEKDNSGMDIKLVKAHKKVVVKDEKFENRRRKVSGIQFKKRLFFNFW